MGADRRLLRRLVLALALMAPALVVCEKQTVTPAEPDPGDPEPAAYFFFGFDCISEFGEVRATDFVSSSDWLVDEIEASEECSEQEGRLLIEGQVGTISPAVDVFTEMLPDYGSYSVGLSATHVLSDAIPDGTTTSQATVQASIQYQATGGMAGPPIEITFEADLATLGDPFGTSTADAVAVTVQCEGDVVDVSVGGLPAILPIDLDFGTGNCTVAMSQVAEIASAGEHTRMLSVRLKNEQYRCSSDEQCWNNFGETDPICGNTEFCQDGDEGDPCKTEFDCDQSTNYCGFDMMCHDGSEGDSCLLDDQCQTGLCVSFVCTP